MQLAAGLNARPAVQQLMAGVASPGQQATNRTGLPDGLKSGVEALSGLSMDSVRVHYNSTKPAQLNALAYAQGSDIHIAPGQDQHLPHEAWHVVQQAQGRVMPALQMQSGTPVNDDEGLEHEADAMGAKALAHAGRPGAAAHAPVLVPEDVIASAQFVAEEDPVRSVAGPGIGTGNVALQRLPSQPARPDVVQRERIQTGEAESIDTAGVSGLRLIELMTFLSGAGGDGNQWAAAAVFGIADALLHRDFLGGRTAGGYVAMLLGTADDALLTPDIQGQLRALMQHPAADTPASTAMDVLAAFNYPLVDGVTRTQYNALRWVMGTSDRAPGAGSLGDLKVTTDGEIDGRPGFPAYTQGHHRPDPVEARRHVVAWHRIRSLMNQMISALGGVNNAADELGQLKIEVPKQVSDEADRLLARRPDRVAGGFGANGKLLLRILFIMNGNPDNLWVGSSAVNSQLPGIYKRTVDAIEKCQSLAGIVELAKTWEAAPDTDQIDDTARRAVAREMLVYWHAIAGLPETEANPDGARHGFVRQAELTLKDLEVDLTPGSRVEGGRVRDERLARIGTLGRLLHGEEFHTRTVLALFQELLLYPNGAEGGDK
jgi:hypothetical protein